MKRPPKRVGIGASLRWSVFARDGFTCRYCGAQAGQNGVTLAVDHILSVAEGGDNRIDNLLTACQRCNGGKGARSLATAPVPKEVCNRVAKEAEDTALMAQALDQASKNREELEQGIVNMKCDAYKKNRVHMARSEASTAINLVREFGADVVADWYVSAACRTTESNAIKYVCGCARRARERGAV